MPVLLFVSVWRRDRVTGLPLVPLWAPAGDPAALRTLLYVCDKQSGALIREIDMDGYSAALPMTYLHGGQQYIVVGVGANEDAELVALALPRKVKELREESCGDLR